MNKTGTSLPVIIKVVSAPLIHEHLLMPCNDDWREGDCCGRREANSDGYYCKSCYFFVHRKCVDEAPQYIQHPSHPGHTLELQYDPYKRSCALCGNRIRNLFYRCEMCDFDVDILCAKYPPPEVIPMHHLTLLKERIEFDCDAAECSMDGKGFPYKCDEFDDVYFHVNCVWNPPKGKHPSKYTIMAPEGMSLPLITELEGVSLPFIHEHPMMPWNDVRKGDCCGLLEAISDGYYCKGCDFFVHRNCVEEFPQYIQHPSHSGHTLGRQSKPDQHHCCNLCGKRIWNLFYRCKVCNFNMDIFCAKYPPPAVVDISEMHHHKLTLLKKVTEFDCGTKCGKVEKGFPYECDECDVSFHVNCVWNPQEAKRQSEVNHTYL